jgi:hypothetical protein
LLLLVCLRVEFDNLLPPDRKRGFSWDDSAKSGECYPIYFVPCPGDSLNLQLIFNLQIRHPPPLSAMPKRHRPTGGIAPRRLPSVPVNEEAPSHDGTLTVAAYWPQLEPDSRPLYAHRIYDTTPDAAVLGRTGELAKVINEKTLHCRQRSDRGEPDRIEVVALPMLEDATTEERLEKCKANYLAEVATREADWHLPRTFRRNNYQRAIVVIDRLGEEWRKAFDRPFTLTSVSFDVSTFSTAFMHFH